MTVPPTSDMLSGIDLLINPSKRPPSDVMSQISAASHDSARSAHSRERSQSFFGGPSTPADATVVRPIVIDGLGGGRKVVEDAVPVGWGDADRRRSVSAPATDDDDEDDDEDEGEGADDEEDEGSQRSYGAGGIGRASSSPVLSHDEVMRLKRQILYQFDRLERKGVRLPRRFTLADSLEDMRAELERLKIDREVDGSIKFQRKALIALVTGIEYLNSAYDPMDIKLEGWSDTMYDNLDEYDDVFEELHMKYRSKANMAPEIKLIMMVGGSGLMFHLANSMFRRSSLPGMEQIMRQNPQLMRDFTQATVSHMQQQGAHAPSKPKKSSGGGGGGGGGILGSLMGLFGGGGGGDASYPSPPTPPPPPPPQQQQQQQPNAAPPGGMMRGPRHVGDILRELHHDAFPGDGGPTIDAIGDTDSEVSELGALRAPRGRGAPRTAGGAKRAAPRGRGGATVASGQMI
jgi:hypothetical protein